jgi:ubiquinone/menaquinone biosynthesis C-methylase UbiE
MEQQPACAIMSGVILGSSSISTCRLIGASLRLHFEIMMTADSEYTVRDQERMVHGKQYFAWQSRMAEAHLGRKILEVGCGLGNFTQHLIDRDLVVGIDVEPRCVENHRRRFSSYSNLVSLCMDVQTPAFLELRKHEPDSIACLNVLEHIEDDALALAHMNAVLPVGGTVVLIVPAFDSLYGPIDHLLGHYRRYSKQSMSQVARNAGFRPRILRYINSVGFFGWWLNARMLKKTVQSAVQIKIFDALIVPVLSRVEDLVEPPVGQSIFTVLEKLDYSGNRSRGS